MLVLNVSGHIPIRDAETKEEFVNKRNAIIMVTWRILLQML